MSKTYETKAIEWACFLYLFSEADIRQKNIEIDAITMLAIQNGNP
jgi:hypothetical protein